MSPYMVFYKWGIISAFFCAKEKVCFTALHLAHLPGQPPPLYHLLSKSQ